MNHSFIFNYILILFGRPCFISSFKMGQTLKTALFRKPIWFVLCFFMVWTQNTSALWGIKLCESVFKKNAILFANYDFKNPLSQTLIESYWLSQQLKLVEPQNKKQKKQWEKGLKDMVEALEHPSPRLAQIGISIENTISKIPPIIELVRKSSPEESLSHQQSLQAVWAIFAKLLPTALKEPDPNQVHWNRIQTILKEIASFDSKNQELGRFSLYKINRAIEKWYSIKELIRCKT